MTADGKIVVFHDDDLQRMCSSPLVIEQATYAPVSYTHLTQSALPAALPAAGAALAKGCAPAGTPE